MDKETKTSKIKLNQEKKTINKNNMEIDIKKTKEDITKEFEELTKKREQGIQALNSINAKLEQLKGQFQLLENLEKADKVKPKKGE